jgi:ubiquinol-cytochrome c reductase iron-sulfur subunit
MTRALRKVVSVLVGLVLTSVIGRLRPRRREPAPPPLPGGSRRAALVVASLLAGAGIASAAFIAVYLASDAGPPLGLTLGAAFALLAAALVIASQRLVPQVEEREERKPHPAPPEVSDAAADALGGPQLPRRTILGAAAFAAFTALGAALVLPLASLGSGVDSRLDASPWRRGRRLVDTDGAPFVASEIALGAFLTAFPEGADPRSAAAPVVLVRIPAETLDLPAGRRGWAPDGILAYSKTCTHAACAVSLFRYPMSRETSAGPALVCPCHYSTFDVARGAAPIFGPAARALPQLPLEIAPDGTLVAGGPLSGNAGPSWWGVRQ